jgi:phosphate transport system substrate-binding protein
MAANPSLKTAKENGIEIELVPVGLEAFVFFVNKNNPVECLTTDEIRSIYRGNITNWKEVGGPDRTINPLLRIKNSGSQTMMEKFMENDMIKSRSIFAVFGASIGYSFRYYLSGMVANDNVKMLSVNGMYPDETNIQNGLYPLTSSFYVAYRKDNPNPNIKKLVDWILSPEGQRLIEDCGYVAIDSIQY